MIALVVKLAIFAAYNHAFRQNMPADEVIKGLSFYTSDTKDYYEPIERLLAGEGYSLRLAMPTEPPSSQVLPWSFRLPGLLPIYAPLYLMFGKEWGMFLVIIIQFILEILSVFLLAKIAVLLFRNLSLFYICLFLYVLNTSVSVYTLYATSESFCISFFIISIYYLFSYIEFPARKRLFLSGLFLTWAIFFRPTMVLFLPFYIAVLWHYSRNGSKNISFSVLLKNLIVFLSFFFATEACWITRNYLAFRKFIPLNGGFENVATKQQLQLYKLIIAWGGDIQDWNPSEGRWFIKPSNSTKRVYDKEFQKTNPFRTYIFTPDYNLDSLAKLRLIYWKSHDYSATNDSAAYYQDQFMAKAETYLNSFKKNKPFHFHIISRLRLLKTFVLIERPYGLPFIKRNLVNKMIRVLSVAYYYFIFFSAVCGIVLSFMKKDNILPKLFPIGIVLFVLVHVYVGYIEFRYLLPVYPLFTIYASYALYKAASKYKILKVATV